MEYFRNPHLIPFSNLSPEQQMAIIEAKGCGETEFYKSKMWNKSYSNVLDFTKIYRVSRTRMKKEELVSRLMKEIRGSLFVCDLVRMNALVEEIFDRGLTE